jgi:hypothetical protein
VFFIAIFQLKKIETPFPLFPNLHISSTREERQMKRDEMKEEENIMV